MEFSVGNLCRTCMNDESEMLSIFSIEEKENKSYADMLMICATVKVYETDNLPKLICSQCTQQLTSSFNFKMQSEQIDATLREVTMDSDSNRSLLDSSDISAIKEEPEIKQSKSTQETIVKDEPEEVYIEEYIDEANDEEFIAIIEQERKGYTCDNCFKKFTKLGHFLKHKNQHCLDSYECVECKITFKTKHELARHKKIHAKFLKCELCGKEFRSSHGLGYHIKIHTGVKNYECSFENCGKKFALKQALEKHVAVHSKSGKHLCYLCGKMYGTYDALHYHIKTHGGQRPHLCMHCGKTFKQACHLKSHMWIHNGIKPHECKTCGKCYTSGHQLKKHMKKYCANFKQETD